MYLAHLTSYVLQTVRYRVTQPMALRIDRSEGNTTHNTTHLDQPSHLLPLSPTHQLLVFLYINYSSSSLSPTSSTHTVTSYTLRLPRASSLGQQRRRTQHIRPHTHHRCVDRSQYNQSNKVTHFIIVLLSTSITSFHTSHFTTIICTIF